MISFDIKAAQPTAIYHLFSDRLHLPALRAWIEDRQEITRRVGIDIDHVKAAVNAIITCPYTHTLGVEDADVVRILRSDPYIVQLTNEMKEVHKVFLGDYPGLCNVVNLDLASKKSNAGKIARLFQDVETVAMHAIRACLPADAIMDIKHDQVDVELGAEVDIEALRQRMETAALGATGIPFQLKASCVTTSLDIQMPTEPVGDYAEWKADFEREYMFILKKPMGIVHVDPMNGNITPIKFEELRNVYGVQKDFLKRWQEDPARRKYDYVGMYPPPLEAPAKTLNIWDYKSFAADDIEPIDPDTEDVEALLKPFHDLVLHVSGGEPVCVNGLLNFMAQIVQYPGKKVTGVIFSRGNQGCGRNTLLEHLFGDRILGKGLFVLVETLGKLFTKYSFAAEGAIFVFVHESHRKDFADGYNHLKAYTGGTTWEIEHKFHKPFTVQSMARIFINSNDLGATAIPMDDRRIVLQLGSVKPADARFFDRMHADLINNPRAVRAVFEFLMARDLSNYDPDEVIHTTSAARTTRTFQFMRTEGTKFPVFLKSFLPVAERLFRGGSMDADTISVPTAYLYLCFDQWMIAKGLTNQGPSLKAADELNRFKDASAIIVDGNRVEIITKDSNPSTHVYGLGSGFRATHLSVHAIKERVDLIIGSEDVDDLIDDMEGIYQDQYETWRSGRR